MHFSQSAPTEQQWGSGAATRRSPTKARDLAALAIKATLGRPLERQHINVLNKWLLCLLKLLKTGSCLLPLATQHKHCTKKAHQCISKTARKSFVCFITRHIELLLKTQKQGWWIKSPTQTCSENQKAEAWHFKGQAARKAARVIHRATLLLFLNFPFNERISWAPLKTNTSCFGAWSL